MVAQESLDKTDRNHVTPYLLIYGSRSNGAKRGKGHKCLCDKETALSSRATSPTRKERVVGKESAAAAKRQGIWRRCDEKKRARETKSSKTKCTNPKKGSFD
jgi:hypothetical protein